jgi:antitoxin CptB
MGQSSTDSASQTGARIAVQTAVDERTLSRLRWRCRRGLLENDLIIERFFARHEATLTMAQAHGLQALMELSDNDLLDLLLGRSDAEGELAQPEVIAVLGQLRVPRPTTPA